MTTPTPRFDKLRQWLPMTIFLVVIVAVSALLWFGVRDNATKATNVTHAKVGDCMHQVGLTSAEIVKCDDANADFKVVGRVEGKYQFELQINVTSVCAQWPEATVTFWEGEQGQRGTVLCLSELT
jgi:hypothetical protein